MPKTIPGERGRVKVRIVEFELDGNDATLQESLRTISTAINRATGATPKRVEALTASARPAPKSGNGHVADVAEDVPEVDEEDAADEMSDPHSSSQRRRPTTYPQPKVLDIDFNAAEVSLKKFMEEKKPKSHNMKFLAVAGWFDQHTDIEEITSDHVYTAYRAMDWKSRKNMMQPFYVLQKKGWMKQTDAGWTINHIGLDKVKELPAGE